jgi:hypothetical protein
VIYSTGRVEDSSLTVKELEDDNITDFIAPIGAIGMMVTAEGSKMSWLELTRGYECYPGVPGKAHQHRHTNIGIKGDVDGTDAYTFAVDHSHLGLTAYVNVPHTLNWHLSLLERAPTKDMVGHFAVDEAHIHTNHTTSAMLIPYELVEVLLGQDFTARETYICAYPLLEDNGMRDVCHPLLDFLQVASTNPTDGNPHPFTLKDRSGMADYPVHPAVLNQRCASILY